MNATAPNNREKEIFEQALDLAAGAERLAFVKGACGGNATLCARVLALLQAHETDEEFLPEEPKDQATVLLPITQKAGDKIGHYRLMEKIGEGGCGIVYVAEQEEPVRRRVALKVIKLGMDTREVVIRFETERQALAMMDHPNIARVFDGGATDTGRPYFVMELVRGVRITDFCDQHQLPMVERLKLFIQVCHAIQHAHQKGIIHRDIKPSNILVSLHDDTPVPKVIDFGIAKAVGERLTDKTVYTRFEQFMGTPAYMSPEQAGWSDLDIDTRSDIYALGVLLYELLAGRPPFDPKQLAEAGLEAMVRCIREQEPLRPSTRLSKLQQEELTTTAQGRGTEPFKLISLLRGDLDWIVMKCLEKNRTRRYDAANALARDIECYLNQEHITARPPSTAYRVGKFVRRNKVMVVAASAVATALVLGIVGSTWQAIRATRAESKAEQAFKSEAGQRREAEKARANETQLRKQAQAQAYASDMKAAQVALQQKNRGMAMNLLRRYLPKLGDEDLRGLEWRYLWQECQGDEHQNFSHPAMVYSVALSPDDCYLATASYDKKVRVWEVASARQIQQFKGNNSYTGFLEPSRKSVDFSPDGKWLAALGKDGVEIRETSGWSLFKELRSAAAPLCFSDDGRLLVTGGTNGMALWDLTNWNCRIITNAFAAGNNLALTPNGTGLAYCSPRGDDVNQMIKVRIELWDVRTGSKRSIPDTESINSLAVSPDGKWLTSGNDLGEVLLWDLANWAPVMRFRAHQGAVYGLAFSPDSKRLATGGTDQQIHFWETGTTNRLDTRRGHLGEIWSLEFSRDGQQLVSGSRDGTAKLWNTRLDSPKSHTFTVPIGTWMNGPSPDGSTWITTDFRARTYQTWSLPEGRLLRTLSWKEYDPQGFRDVFQIPGNEMLGGVTINGMIHFVSSGNGALLRSVQLAETNFSLWSISPNKQWVLGVLSDAKTGVIFDLRAAPRTQPIHDFYSANCFTGFSPDSHLLAYATTNYAIKLWDLEANQEKGVPSASMRKAEKCDRGVWPPGVGLLGGRSGGRRGWWREVDLIVPGHPPIRRGFGGRGVPHHGQQIIKRIDLVSSTRLDQGHEQVTDLGASLRAIGEAVFAMEDGHLEDALGDIMPLPSLCRVAA